MPVYSGKTLEWIEMLQKKKKKVKIKNAKSYLRQLIKSRHRYSFTHISDFLYL